MSLNIDYFETLRLQAKRMTFEDFARLHEMHSDPIAMENIGGIRTEAQTLENLHWNLQQWQDNNFGLWMFYEKTAGEWVGKAGLRRLIVEGFVEVELAYALVPKFWDQGYATEMSKACLKIGFNNFKLANIIAITRESNLASQRVIKKLQFTYEKSFHQYGHTQFCYRLLAPT